MGARPMKRETQTQRLIGYTWVKARSSDLAWLLARGITFRTVERYVTEWAPVEETEA